MNPDPNPAEGTAERPLIVTPETEAAATPAEPKPFLAKLGHCGAIHVAKEKITGWYHPISLQLWEKIVGFHYFVSKQWSAESVSYHRWNPELGEYDTIIPFQTTTGGGLSVRTPWGDPRNKALVDEYEKEHKWPFFPACTIHTHVNAAAFESGTDAHDESDWCGWHMTIGKLVVSPTYDLDCRHRLPKVPGVKKFTDPDVPYPLSIQHLFRKEDIPAVLTTIGNDTFHEFLNRVTITGHGVQYGNGLTADYNPNPKERALIEKLRKQSQDAQDS